MYRITALFAGMAIFVILLISFDAVVNAGDGKRFYEPGEWVDGVRALPSSPGRIEIHRVFPGKDSAGKKEKFDGNKQRSRKKRKCTEKRCRRKQKRKHPGNYYWGVQSGNGDTVIMILEPGEDDDENRKEVALQKEWMKEEQRIREEETRREIERINKEDWFR